MNNSGIFYIFSLGKIIPYGNLNFSVFARLIECNLENGTNIEESKFNTDRFF